MKYDDLLTGPKLTRICGLRRGKPVRRNFFKRLFTDIDSRETTQSTHKMPEEQRTEVPAEDADVTMTDAPEINVAANQESESQPDNEPYKDPYKIIIVGRPP
jgi:hypothetical protein